MKNHYNIMTSCDENLVPYVAVGLTAMAYNLKNANIDFFLLHRNISQKNIEMLRKLCENFQEGNIAFHDILVPNPEIYDELARYGNGWSGEAYYSLGAHLLLPNDVDRVLYLDAGDTLVIDDIAPYYDYDFDGKSLVVTGGRYKKTLNAYSTNDLGDRKNGLPCILRGIFNSGSYVMNLRKMREEGITLDDYQSLSQKLRSIYGEDCHDIYFGDQGLLSVAFVGDVQYYDYCKIRNIWYMPYNFCLWYFNRNNQKLDYEPAILHFTGAAFKPWNGTYPIFIERFQKKELLQSMQQLKEGQVEFYNLWYEYAILTDEILKKIGY